MSVALWPWIIFALLVLGLILIDPGVSGLGIDTLSVDCGLSKDFEVHRLCHGAGL
ncbi:MAG: hypothetical protein ACE5H2_03690 [Terriglobia bacterium]